MRALLFFLILICAFDEAHAGESCEQPACGGPSSRIFPGKVVAVLDGDTLLLSPGNNPPIKVRLAGIDAPEMSQEYGVASKQSLAELVLRKQVQAGTRAVDSYGRVVAMISMDGRNINEEQVRRGMAWADSRSTGNKMLSAQIEAQEAKRGLWSQSYPLRPGKWRKMHAVLPQPSQQDSVCASKRYCSQMISCDEAEYHLVQCGLKSLDSDGDGVPCEKLCAAQSSPAIESLAK